MSSLELYHSPGSLYSQQVKLVLAEKNIEYKSYSTNLLTFENLQPAYIRINPKGVVPTLIHNSKTICDSAKIIQYLEQRFPNSPLIPDQAELEKRMNYWVDTLNQFPMGEFMYANYKGLDGLVLRRSIEIKEKLIPLLMERNPDLTKQYQAKLQDVHFANQTIRNEQKINQINTNMEVTLEKLEQELSEYKSEWLCGSNYSLADMAWSTVLNRLEELKFAGFPEMNQQFAIKAYFMRLKNRPSFKVAIQQDKMPTKFIIAGLRRIFLGF